MASIRKIPNGHWQVQVRRFGRKLSKVFDTHQEAEDFARRVEEQWKRDYEMETSVYARYGAFMAAWQLARLQLLGDGWDREPDEWTIATEIARDSSLRFIAFLHHAPQTALTIMEHRAALEHDMTTAADRRRGRQLGLEETDDDADE